MQQHPANTELLICTLADGQGGQRGGGPAARLACKVVLEKTLQTQCRHLTLPSTWLEILGFADNAVNKDPEAGYTTLIGFGVVGNMLCGVSNGDSALAVFEQDGRLHELTQQQEKNPPVGSGMASLVPFARQLVPPWTLIGMTDGVCLEVCRLGTNCSGCEAETRPGIH